MSVGIACRRRIGLSSAFMGLVSLSLALHGCANPAQSKTSPATTTYSVSLSVGGLGVSEGKGLDGDGTVASVTVVVYDTASGSMTGSGSLAPSGSDANASWKGQITISETGGETFKAYGWDSDGCILYVGSTTTTIPSSGKALVTIGTSLVGSVTYDDNGATSGSAPTDSASYASGDPISVAGNGSLARSGYHFAGWTTNNLGAGSSRAAGSSVTKGTGNVILYAVWMPASCTYTSSGNSITLNAWTATSGGIEIPCGVTSIGNYAFSSRDGLTGSLTIPASVTSIGSNAFSGCSGLTGDLTIPDSVTSIGSNAFNSCSGFNGSLTIPSSVTSIGTLAFYSCYNLTGDLTIPDSVTSLGDYAFNGDSGFNGSLKLSSGVTSIGSQVFYNCTGLTGSLTIPTSVTSIGDDAFHNCSSISGSLTIPDSVTSIGQQAFMSCSNLSGTLTIGSGAASIGTYAFFFCGYSSVLVLGESPASLGSYSFKYVSITVPKDYGPTYKNAWSGYASFIQESAS